MSYIYDFAIYMRFCRGLKAHIKTITTDNGTEFVCHEMISKALEMIKKIYIAAPYSSWQKGAIENENKLIRQNIPKFSSFAGHSYKQITKLMHKIIIRPREKLNFTSPSQCFYEKII